MDDSRSKQMKLYQRVDRVFNELRAIGMGDNDPIPIELLCDYDQYHYFGTDAIDEAIELSKELGLNITDHEIIRTNSTGLTIYNPSNLASMIKGMKNKNQTREDKIKARLQYEKQALN